MPVGIAVGSNENLGDRGENSEKAHHHCLASVCIVG